MDRLNRLNGRVYGSVPKIMISLMGLVVGLLSVMGLIGYLGSTEYKLEGAGLHRLPAAPRILTDPPEKIVIEDKSPYAREEDMSLYQYTSYRYNGGLLMEEVGYDEQGGRKYLHTLEYDTAGNILRERTENGTDEVQSDRHIYEYDEWGRVVHEEVFWDGELVERHYLRYTDEGCAGVKYSYLNEQVDGGISQYCADHTEFLEDREGNMLCAFKMNSLQVEIPNEACKMQWHRQGGYLTNRVQYYYRDWFGQGNSKDWYQDIGQADGEQFNLYEFMPEEAGRRLALRLNYEWKDDLQAYSPMPTFYQARYDKGRLLWQMSYVEGALTYYSACLYDAEGRLQEAVEYTVEGEKPEARFHRYEYPEENSEEQYSYVIQSREFDHAFGDGGRVRFVFSGEGVLSGMEMTDVSENGRKIYEFDDSGENVGKLRRMCTETEEAGDEAAFLEKLAEEAAAYGFQAGEDLKVGGSGTEGGAE